MTATAPAPETVLPPHLADWGPDVARVATPAEAAAHCRRLALGHYENFPVDSLLLPARLKPHFHAVYAFCRWADDLADEVDGAADSLALLDWWRGLTRACFDGHAAHPVFVALRPTVVRFGLDERPFLDLISAFEQDQTVAEYESFADLRDYCRRSADPVGRIVLKLLDADGGENRRLSDSVCTGLQLINFWQDVARDADIGRCYLPHEDRERFGYADADLAARRTTPAFLDLMRFEVDRAESFLTAGLPLARRLRGRPRVVVDLFARGGSAVCEKIRRTGYRVWGVRPTVTKADGVKLLAAATLRAVRP